MANTSKKSTNAKTKSTKSTKSTKTAKTRKGTAPATERVTRIKASESSAPRVVGVKTKDSPRDSRCEYLYEPAYYMPNHWEEADAAREIVTALNAKIKEVVEKTSANPSFGSGRLHFVSATEGDSPFNGHGLCDSGDSYFQNIDQAGLFGGQDAYIFHPNARGQQAYAQLVKKAIG